MPLPVIRHDVAESCLRRLSDKHPLGDEAGIIQNENPEYLRTVSMVALRTDIRIQDALFVAFFCYFLLKAQVEVQELETLVGGDRAPTALR
jgi:hypothetical protein